MSKQFRYVNSHKRSSKPVKSTRIRNKEKPKGEVYDGRTLGIGLYVTSLLLLLATCFILGVF